MLLDDDPPQPVLNITKYAKRMGISRQTVYSQLSQSATLVPPIVGTHPAKWLASAVDAFLAGGGE